MYQSLLLVAEGLRIDEAVSPILGKPRSGRSDFDIPIGEYLNQRSTSLHFDRYP